MIGAAHSAQYPGEGSKFSIPCFPKYFKLQVKEPQIYRNDTIGLLETRLSRVAGSVVGLMQTTAFVLGKRSSALDSLYL